MHRALSAWIGAALIGLSGAAMAADGAPQAAAEAPAKPTPKTGVSSILKLLDWGASSADVLAVAKADIEAGYADRLKQANGDTFAVDAVLRAQREEFAAVKKTLVQFIGARSGFEASIIADEYRSNEGESMLRIDDANAQRYYFFVDDKLWKIVVAYNSTISRSVAFPAFVKQVSRKNGRPTEADWVTPPGGTRTMRAAVWADDLTQLTVEDRTAFFGTFVMRFVEKSAGVARDARRAEPDSTPAPSRPSDGMLADIMGDTDGAATADVVDQLTGQDHAVDLAAGLPQDEVIRRDAPAAAKASGRKAKRKAAAEAPKSDAPPAAGGDDVIIY